MSTNENKGKKAEVTALQAISAEDRKDWISLAFVQAGICVCVPASDDPHAARLIVITAPKITANTLFFIIVVSFFLFNISAKAKEPIWDSCQ